ncbi:MAG: glycoside hydrolase family 10 protein [Gemmatimonadaceae bacterium]
MRNSRPSPLPRAIARASLVPALLALCSVAVPAQERATSAPASATSPVPPAVPREFRGAWVAAVANIDWPSRPGLSTWDQQRELRAILDRAVALHLNAIVLHVRPAADALYPSAREPWSEYLTGQQGVGPEPAWDPLATAVAEAHARGLELHAWFNPYRGFHPSAKTTDTARTHVSRARPSLVRRYGAHLWMDPGDPAVRRHSVGVVLDVVRRYDVDGVHIDDYFYPYKERDAGGTIIDFPDSATYARYRARGGTLGRDDWRRHNVDEYVHELYAGVKAAKPWVRVGISPFGIWRPGTPPDVTGFDAYQEIYADSRTWLRNGWVDYFAPQLYWPVNAAGQRFSSLLRFWTGENVRHRHIWPGLYTSRSAALGGRGAWPTGEVLEQVRLTRENPGSTGNIHFSMKALMPGGIVRTDTAITPSPAADTLAAQLLHGPYAEVALPPASPWLDRTPVPTPRVRFVPDSATGGTRLAFRPRGNAVIRWWTVQRLGAAGWETQILPGDARTHLVTRRAGDAPPRAIWIRAVDRVGKESRAVVLEPRPSGARWTAALEVAP